MRDGRMPVSDSTRKWYFRKSIDYSVSLNYAVLDYAMRYRDELLYNIYKMGHNSIERGQKDYWTLSPKRVDAINQLYATSRETATTGRRRAGADSTNGPSGGAPAASSGAPAPSPT